MKEKKREELVKIIGDMVVANIVATSFIDNGYEVDLDVFFGCLTMCTKGSAMGCMQLADILGIEKDVQKYVDNSTDKFIENVKDKMHKNDTIINSADAIIKKAANKKGKNNDN